MFGVVGYNLTPITIVCSLFSTMTSTPVVTVTPLKMCSTFCCHIAGPSGLLINTDYLIIIRISADPPTHPRNLNKRNKKSVGYQTLLSSPSFIYQQRVILTQSQLLRPTDFEIRTSIWP